MFCTGEVGNDSVWEFIWRLGAMSRGNRSLSRGLHSLIILLDTTGIEAARKGTICICRTVKWMVMS